MLESESGALIDTANIVINEIENHQVASFDKNGVQSIYIFGGYINGNFFSNNVYRLFADSREKPQTGVFQLEIEKLDVKGLEPSPRYSHSIAAIQSKQCFYVFGGVTSNNQLRSSQLWKFDTVSLKWSLETE